MVIKSEPELVRSEVRAKANEAGFSGHIEFRRWMPTPGQYDFGLLPDWEVSTTLKILREDLPLAARGRPVIYLEYERKTRKQLLATLAHELGHYEQGPLLEPSLAWSPEWLRREVEAQALGLKWAIKWSVAPSYLRIERQLREIGRAFVR